MPNARLLALDIDGTLLSKDKQVRPETAAAVARAAKAGIQPVLCTGRRYRRALPVAQQLGLAVPIVCNSGALVKEPVEHRTLWRADWETDLLAALLELLHHRDEPAVSIVDHGATGPDFLISAYPTGRALFDEYVERNNFYACIDPTWMHQPNGRAFFHLFAVGSRPEMLEVEAAIGKTVGDQLRTFVLHTTAYTGTMCEIIRGDAGKWAAVLHLAERWDLDPSDIVAIGDDVNDLPMITGSGFGVAMGQAPDQVRAAADHVTKSQEDDGVAAFIDDVLLG